MASVRSGDLELYYETHGEGPPVLYIGGTGGDLRNQPNVFDGPLARTFRVVAHDQRGLGRSAKPDRRYPMAEYADDAAAVLDGAGVDQAAVVGVSFGGMVAQELTLRHRGRVSRLVLCCTSSGGAGGASYPLHELEGLDPDIRRRRSLAISDTRYGLDWQDEHGAEAAALLEAMAARDEAKPADRDARRGAFRQLEARADHDTWDRLGSIRVPTLVCAGRYDGLAPLANATALAERIPGARLEVFEGGHLFLAQDRRAWPVIVGFLAP